MKNYLLCLFDSPHAFGRELQTVQRPSARDFETVWETPSALVGHYSPNEMSLITDFNAETVLIFLKYTS